MMNEGRRNSYDAVSLATHESLLARSESSSSEEVILVTSSMVHNLECGDQVEKSFFVAQNNAPTPPGSLAGSSKIFQDDNYVSDMLTTELFSPQLMIVYEGGDINCALHFLIRSMQEPFEAHAVATVLVEAPMRKEFVERIKLHLRPLSDAVASHPNYLATLEMIKKLKVKTVMVDDSLPILVLDCLHSKLGDGPTGVICLHTFRSSQDIIGICRKESLQFDSVSIWNQSIEGLYQLVVSIDCSTFYFNCTNVSLTPISSVKIDVCVADGFHYETLAIKDKKKIVVFPVGEHLIQKSAEPPLVFIPPISFLNE